MVYEIGHQSRRELYGVSMEPHLDEKHPPCYYFTCIRRARYSSFCQLTSNDFFTQGHWVVEGEQCGEIKVSSKEMSMNEISSGMHTLNVSFELDMAQITHLLLVDETDERSDCRCDDLYKVGRLL